MNENKFSPRAERALELAEQSASDLGHRYIGSEHLLLGLILEEEGIAHRVLTEQGLTAEMVQQILVSSVGRGAAGTKPDQGLTPRAKHAIECAMEDAVRGGFVAADFGVSKADHAFIIGRYAAADAAIAVQHAGFHADAAVACEQVMLHAFLCSVEI